MPHIGLEPIDDEPDERPDRLGRELLSIVNDPDKHGRWFRAASGTSRSYLTAAEGRLTGRVAARIAGIPNIDGWQARVRTRDDNGTEVHELIVKYTPPATLLGTVQPPTLDALDEIR